MTSIAERISIIETSLSQTTPSLDHPLSIPRDRVADQQRDRRFSPGCIWARKNCSDLTDYPWEQRDTRINL
jgi:hypothetical protein